MNDFFNTLGIEATKEEKKIKKAYRARLHAVNPEDDPDGFKRLREAYEEALKYARQKEEEPENLSPAEEFISRCEQLYKDFYRRIDEQEWEKLFSEDICHLPAFQFWHSVRLLHSDSLILLHDGKGC